MNSPKICFVMCEDMILSAITLPLELIHSAYQYQNIRNKKNRNPDVKFVSNQIGKTITSFTGLTVKSTACYSDKQNYDLIIIPAIWRNPKRAIVNNQPLITWLSQQNITGATIAGVGTGCCFMAEAGLLDDKDGTTHWHYFDQFSEKYPKVNLKRQYFITQSDNLYCAGSVNSLAELTVYFIQTLFGGQAAHHVQKHFFHEIRSPIGLNERLIGGEHYHSDEVVSDAQILIQKHVSKPLKVFEIAKKLNISERSLNRRFHQATGSSPVKYILKERMNVAIDLLKSSNLAISEISQLVGFGDPASFSAAFKKHFLATPSEYRSTVRAKMFSSRISS